MSGFDIQSEVAAALIEAGEATGSGALYVTILRPAAQPENPWDAPAGDPIEFEAVATVSTYSQHQVDGTLILAGDLKVWIDPRVVVVNTADRIVIPAPSPHAGEYRVLGVDPLALSDMQLLPNLHCRR